MLEDRRTEIGRRDGTAAGLCTLEDRGMVIGASSVNNARLSI